ncbi:hypothetical protein FNH08_22675 [Streptomyces spongiae]|uniref:Uncharacterized protein n=1 Tax=Streptomyces spongiae TaxID=565072 RepID=A0A5N8XLD2_9ACTN|nr:hypothetical protein [Streptomyces spongiae]
MGLQRVKPHAEIAEVWPRDGRIRLVGRIHGHSGEGAWTLVLTRRAHSDQRLRYDAHVKGDRFEGELPIADLTTADHAAVEEWDIHLSDGETELRAGRRLDDIRGKKKIFVYPEQHTGNIGVRPYYTVKDNLSLECRTGGAA